MQIRPVKTGKNRYLMRQEAGNSEESTPREKPISRRRLIREMSKQGMHPRDIWDAIADADRSFESSQTWVVTGEEMARFLRVADFDVPEGAREVLLSVSEHPLLVERKPASVAMHELEISLERLNQYRTSVSVSDALLEQVARIPGNVLTARAHDSRCNMVVYFDEKRCPLGIFLYERQLGR